jgi:two-component system sensor histidine kinase BarA
VDVGALVQEVGRLGEGLRRGAGVTLRVTVEPALPAAHVDALRLRQVVTNLVSNALKFTEEGEVVLSLRRAADGGLLLAVSDTGIGIPEERLEAIWKPFEQAEAGTTRRFGGTGLGLPIVRSLAALMGLSVDVLSRVGVGSTFTVRIPPAWIVAEAEQAPSAAALVNSRSPILKNS